MHKTELVRKVADESGFAYFDVYNVINALQKVIIDAMVDGDTVSLPSVGYFRTKMVKGCRRSNGARGYYNHHK